ncbi:hypothetical protein Afil01_58470 [Actinorhabdospora filicis]|uniref:Uncharacterized protein n=1 Tax=Actinorhabdospora filicis TaxID=1785913 RepID=A0A9W6SQD6_9ACTN|nr:hypothetical protein [Actinorhabdospora filicis]GLZ81040.1 hypothetical protein Afil01_58470 [Actinorhabdospora filicis]
MTEDLKILLDEASSSGSPPLAFSAEDVVAKGRRRSQRRTGFAGAGLAVLTVLAVGAGVVLNGGGGGSPVAAGEPSPSDSSPSVWVTRLYPPEGAPVYWGSTWATRDATGDAISATLAAYLKQHYPNVKNVLWGPGEAPEYNNTKTLVDPADPGSSFRIDRYQAMLTTSRDGSYSVMMDMVPIYRNWSGETGPGDDMGGGDNADPVGNDEGIQLVVDGGDGTENVEALRVAVFPANTYVQGFDSSAEGTFSPTGGRLISGCDEQTEPGEHGKPDTKITFECDETTGPNGERILTSVRTAWWKGSPITDYTAVVYRADGTAVVLGTKAEKPIGWKQGQSFDREPGLSMADMIAMALAVPPVTF